MSPMFLIDLGTIWHPVTIRSVRPGFFGRYPTINHISDIVAVWPVDDAHN